jgi:GNAT superfamily N-acetyltransferase
LNEPSKVVSLELRPYRDADEPDVIDLLSATLGPGPAGIRPPEFFRWKHLESPFGRSYMLVAEEDGRIVGLRAFMRWRFRVGGRVLRAVRAVDTATHPDYQGRGIFSRLTHKAVEDLSGQADLIFNTPNDQSLPGYLKMGWGLVGTVPVSVRMRRVVPLVAALARSRVRTAESQKPGPLPEVFAESAAEALRDPGLSSLLAEAEEEAPDDRITTPRDLRYIQWRYGSAPLLQYRAVRQESGGELTGIALFRVRPRGGLCESTVAEVIVRPGDRATARRLLNGVIGAAAVDHLTCHFPSGSIVASAARRMGFLRVPGGLKLVVNRLHEGVQPDPTDLRSWALTLGDLEVF